MTSGLTQSGLISPNIPEAQAGIGLSMLCHYLSVIVLYKLSVKLFSGKPPTQSRILSFVATSLHIINPAGAFLLAPYSEAMFSLLNFAGFYLYLDSLVASGQGLQRDLRTLFAGVIFGLATTVRSNGILSGIPFAYSAATTLLETFKCSVEPRIVRRLLFIILGGSFVALGGAFPQYVAYVEYCGLDSPDTQLRPWCTSFLPSIYSWVQSHYW
jgi:Gpi18-like mannosyltransferase